MDEYKMEVNSSVQLKSISIKWKQISIKRDMDYIVLILSLISRFVTHFSSLLKGDNTVV